MSGITDMLFGKTSTPTLPPPSATPSVATPAVQAASQATRMRERVASGRAATMLTSSQDQSVVPETATKKLLGQ